MTYPGGSKLYEGSIVLIADALPMSDEERVLHSVEPEYPLYIL